MQRRDRQNEVVVAIVVFSALALALAFGILLTLGNNTRDPQVTPTRQEVLVENTLTSIPQTADPSHPIRPPRPTDTATRRAIAQNTTPTEETRLTNAPTVA